MLETVEGEVPDVSPQAKTFVDCEPSWSLATRLVPYRRSLWLVIDI